MILPIYQNYFKNRRKPSITASPSTSFVFISKILGFLFKVVKSTSKSK